MPLADAREPVDHALEWRSYSPSAVKIKLASESNAVIAEALSTTDEAAPTACGSQTARCRTPFSSKLNPIRVWSIVPMISRQCLLQRICALLFAHVRAIDPMLAEPKLIVALIALDDLAPVIMLGCVDLVLTQLDGDWVHRVHGAFVGQFPIAGGPLV